MDKQNIFNNYLDYIRYKYTPHGFSRLKCLKCGCVWVAHAEYVKKTINIEQQKELFYE